MRKRFLFAASLLPVMFLAGSLLAQGTLLEQGKGLLGTLGGKSGGTASTGGLSSGEIGSGLREALKVGTERVVGRLGRTDGFNADKDVHIPLPDTLRKVQSGLKMVGASGLADDLELRMNRAAEVATPKAKELFWQAIGEMTIEDAERIWRGPNDAATQYFRGKMSQPLAVSMRPVVDESLAEAGAVKSYDAMMGRYQQIPMMPDVKANLTDWVLEKAMDGIFLYLGREEAAIRTNPAQRTTDLLRKVFGAS